MYAMIAVSENVIFKSVEQPQLSMEESAKTC